MFGRSQNIEKEIYFSVFWGFFAIRKIEKSYNYLTLLNKLQNKNKL